MVQVFDQHSELTSLMQPKTEQKLNHHFDSSENEYDELLAVDETKNNTMNNILERYEILTHDDKAYSELARHDIGIKYKRLEIFDFELGSCKELSDMAVQKYGFIASKFRRKAWPRLILNTNTNTNNNNDSSKKQLFNQITQEQIKSNKYYLQVTLDVNRTLKRFPPEINDDLRAKLQDELIDLICKILIRNDKLHYYQGYHDICLTFMLVNGVEESLPLIENLTLTHLTSFMETTMEGTLKLLLNIMPLLNELNEQVAEHLQKAELGVIFSLSWLITWYSHVTDNIQIILRLYDFFIASDPLMPVYFGAIIVDDKSDEVLDIECEMSSLHTIISKYPSKIEDIEILEKYIEKAVALFKKHPPKQLSSLNTKWIEKCKKLQEERERIELEKRLNLKRRRHKPPKKSSLFSPFRIKSENNNNSNNNHESDDESRHQMLSPSKPKMFANRFMVGFTLSIGVAAIATLYAMNSAKDPQEILAKVVQLIS